jgi:hypothetical protein
MGWEDLGYGWLLHQHGYRQMVLTEAVVDDHYEYHPQTVGPFKVQLSEKPPWYTYYRIRNLILVGRRVKLSPAVSSGMALRVVFDFLPAVALKSNKRERLSMYLRGLADGLRGCSGKWRLPE